MILDKRVKSQVVSEEEHGTPRSEPLWCNTSYMRAKTVHLIVQICHMVNFFYIIITVFLFRSGHNPPDPCNPSNRPVTRVSYQLLDHSNNK